MGAQWKQAGREVAAQKKGQLIGKIVREILVAAKLGGGDPDLNPRLAAAVEKARKNSVTRDTIERAVKKGSGQTGETMVIESLVYEGFAPHKVAVVVECLTDNRNRLAPEIRNAFRAGHLGAPGSVAWMFDHVGLVEAHHADRSLDLETVAIEAGAQNVESWVGDDVPGDRLGGRFTCDRGALDAVAKYLAAHQWTVVTSEMTYLAKNPAELPEDQRQEVVGFLNALDDLDDVHRVYAGLK
ncbi:MAG TPA: YebC/PmpR family DNA-binding transcriptional regulator [Verrucomicrobiota bacterium]|nr:YebC/PmpR family DNA-binding transcriptional regulator [Verrucomicrobiota bacterium]